MGETPETDLRCSDDPKKNLSRTFETKLRFEALPVGPSELETGNFRIVKAGYSVFSNSYCLW